MRKSVIFAILAIITLGNAIAFEQSPFLAEINYGYSVGILNQENTHQTDIKLYYLGIDRFGFVIEAGTTLPGFHMFMGPMMYVISTPKLRIPITIGYDVTVGNGIEKHGIGLQTAIHYSFAKNFYVGINLGVSYVFNGLESYLEEKTNIIHYKDPETKERKQIETLAYEKKNRKLSENYFSFKPAVLIGFQF